MNEWEKDEYDILKDIKNHIKSIREPKMISLPPTGRVPIKKDLFHLLRVNG